jgi:hypothetical protein
VKEVEGIESRGLTGELGDQEGEAEGSEAHVAEEDHDGDDEGPLFLGETGSCGKSKVNANPREPNRSPNDSPYFLKSLVRTRSMMMVMLQKTEATVEATVIQ